MASFRTYYQLAKPGIVYGNGIAAIAGFLLASEGNPYLVTFVGMLVGISLVMASACVFNNYIDRDIDDAMARTKGRALVTGEISVKNALVYATVLGLAGLLLLAFLANALTALVALFGHFMYVVVYGIAKRKTVHGTVIGSISGSIPPVVGYVAVTNNIDALAVLLFSALVFWQMPHFYAIAIYRLQDYKRAGIPVLPAVEGMEHTKAEMLLYIIGFVLIAASFTALGHTGFVYLAVMLVLGLRWLQLGLQGFHATDDALWARQLFKFSLYVLLGFCIALSLDAFLP